MIVYWVAFAVTVTCGIATWIACQPPDIDYHGRHQRSM